MSNVKPDWYYGVETKVSMEFEFSEKPDGGTFGLGKWEDFESNMTNFIQDLEGVTMLAEHDYYCRFGVVFSQQLSIPEIIDLIDQITEFGELQGTNRVEVGTECL